MFVHNLGAESSSARCTHLRLQILSKFGGSADLQPGQPDVDEQLRCASAARLTDAKALLIVTGNSWAAHTARRLLTTRSTPAMRGAAGQLYAEPSLQHFRRAVAMETDDAQRGGKQQGGNSDVLCAKRRKTASATPVHNASSAAAHTAAAPTPATASHGELSLNSLVWAQCRGHPFWPGRVVSMTASSVRVDFFGDDTTQTFKPYHASVLPFQHERSHLFVEAGCAQHDADLRTKFSAGHQDALQARQQELQQLCSARDTAAVCHSCIVHLPCNIKTCSLPAIFPSVYSFRSAFLLMLPGTTQCRRGGARDAGYCSCRYKHRPS